MVTSVCMSLSCGTASAVENPVLRAELLAMAAEDQRVRAIPLTPAERTAVQGGTTITPGPGSALTAIPQADARHTARMHQIIDRYGWPGFRLVGADGSNAAWLLVQHADADPGFQERCLGLLQQAVDHHDADAKDLAYLADRVAVHQGKDQEYGTQVRIQGSQVIPFTPIDDPANLDKRRARVGLPPYHQYISDLRRNRGLG